MAEGAVAWATMLVTLLLAVAQRLWQQHRRPCAAVGLTPANAAQRLSPFAPAAAVPLPRLKLPAMLPRGRRSTDAAPTTPTAAAPSSAQAKPMQGEERSASAVLDLADNSLGTTSGDRSRSSLGMTDSLANSLADSLADSQAAPPFTVDSLPEGLRHCVVDPSDFTYLRGQDGQLMELGSGAW